MTDERRKEPRESRRVMLTFVKVGEKKVTRGIALNVSRTGLLVASGTVFPRGTRVLVTEVNDPAQIAREFEVRNTQRLTEGQAMGLRAVISGKVADATLPVAEGAPPTPVALSVPRIQEIRALPADLTAGPAPTEEPTSSEHATVFTMRFDSLAAYHETYLRDFKRGGAFIRAAILPEQDELVLIEVIPPIEGAKRLLGEAKVVFRGGGGFGVEFSDRAAVLAMLPAP